MAQSIKGKNYENERGHYLQKLNEAKAKKEDLEQQMQEKISDLKEFMRLTSLRNEQSSRIAIYESQINEIDELYGVSHDSCRQTRRMKQRNVVTSHLYVSD